MCLLSQLSVSVLLTSLQFQVRRNMHSIILTWLSFLYFFFFLKYCGLNLGPIPWTTPPALFRDGFFQDNVCQTIWPGWLRTTILLISASWEARIIGMSHGCPSSFLPSFLLSFLPSLPPSFLPSLPPSFLLLISFAYFPILHLLFTFAISSIFCLHI
jgi:hypothetical protein